jgi:hypothetical protein
MRACRCPKRKPPSHTKAQSNVSGSYEILFGTDPKKVLELLAAEAISSSGDDSLETTPHRLPPT